MNNKITANVARLFALSDLILLSRYGITRERIAQTIPEYSYDRGSAGDRLWHRDISWLLEHRPIVRMRNGNAEPRSQVLYAPVGDVAPGLRGLLARVDLRRGEARRAE